jgi:hypothetical protein
MRPPRLDPGRRVAHVRTVADGRRVLLGCCLVGGDAGEGRGEVTVDGAGGAAVQ